MLKKSLQKSMVLLALLACSFAFAAVDVNKASEADLDGIRGLGPVTTRAILSERKKSDFKNWEDLMTRVKGIGESRAQKLSASGLTVAGSPYRSGSITSSQKSDKQAVRSEKVRADKSSPSASKAKDVGEEKR